MMTQVTIRRCGHWMAVLGITALIAGCGSVGKVAPAPSVLDLGAPSALKDVQQTTAANDLVVTLAQITSSPSLKDNGVLWREGPSGMLHQYATYQWVASPDAMVHERLLEGLSKKFVVLDGSGGDGGLTLRVNLQQFEQIYSAGGSSNEGVVGLQAVLLKGTRVLGQWRDVQTEAAKANDAPAGASALRTATDRLVDRLGEWVLKTAAR